ncbi:MAG: efflux RND transporter periplasmic adaptor subunit [Myxococcales bacterium]|nr:efflux RND transporter periplasmic adaptor subunit [Myxococcales bacterium]
MVQRLAAIGALDLAAPTEFTAPENEWDDDDDDDTILSATTGHEWDDDEGEHDQQLRDAGRRRFDARMADFGMRDDAFREVPEPPHTEMVRAEQRSVESAWRAESRRMFNAALVMYKQGLVIEAIRYLKALIELDPENVEARSMLEIINGEMRRRGATSLEAMQSELMREIGAHEQDDDEDDEEDDEEEEDDEDDAVPPAGSHLPKPSIGRRLLKWGIRLGVVGVLALIASLIPVQLSAKHDCTLRPARRRAVRPTIDGLIGEVLKGEGERVKKGELVVKLDKTDLERQLQSGVAEIAAVDAEIKRLKRGATKEERVSAWREVRSKLLAVRIKRGQCRRLRRLVRQGVVARDKLRTCTDDLRQRQAAAAEQRARLSVLTKKPSPEELAQLAAKRDALVAKRRLVEDQLKGTMVYSPIEGTIVTRKLKERLGSRVQKGETLFEVADSSTMDVEVKVAEEDLDIIKVGQPVELKVTSMPERSFTGKVVAIAAKVEVDSTTKKRYLVVRSRVSNPKRLLRPDMTGVARIDGGKTTLLYQILRRVIRTIRLNCVL